MSDAELWTLWRVWMAVAAVLVVVAAALLVTIWVTAKRILAETLRALAAAEQIQANTAAIWELQKTNEMAARMLDTVGAIEQKGTALVQVLEGEAVGPG